MTQLRPKAIDRANAAVAGLAYTQMPAADSAEQESLQQTVPLARWAGENFTVGPVRGQAFAIGEELIPRGITRMTVRNNNAPLILWQLAGLRTDLAGRVELLARLVAAKHLGAGVRWISKNADHP